MKSNDKHILFIGLLTVLSALGLCGADEAADAGGPLRLVTESFEVVVGPKGLQRFAAAGAEDALLNNFSWRYLRREEKEDLWPGTVMDLDRFDLTQTEDGTINLLQTYEDFDFRWRFAPVHDGRGLEIECAALARRDFRSGEQGAQMPQIGWAQGPGCVVYSDGKDLATRHIGKAKAMPVGADWLAFQGRDDLPWLLLVALTENWHKRVRPQPPSFITSTDWPREVHRGDEFRMHYQLVPFTGPVPLALEQFLPREEKPPVDLPGGFAFWPAHALEHVPFDAAESLDRIREGADRPGFDLRLARGEVEPFQVVFTPATGQRFSDVALELTPLRSANGKAALPPTALSWRRVRYLNRSAPDVLEHPAPFAAGGERDRNYPMWVDVSVPADSAPGNYEAEVRVRAGGKVLAQLPLRVRVWDFELPRRVPLRTALFAFWPNFLRAHYPAAASKDVMHGMLRAGCESLAAHHMVHNTDTTGVVPWRPSVERLMTPEGEREFLEWCGFWSGHGLAIGEVRVCEPEFWEHYWPIFKQHGWADEIFSGHDDEYATLERAMEAQREAETLRQVAPGLKFMSTAIGAGLTVHEAADPATDIWSTTPHVFTSLRSFFEGRREDGESVWLYIHHHIRLAAGPAAARAFFWQLSRLGFDGCCLYGLNVWGKEPMEWTADGLIQKSTYMGYPPGSGVLYWPGPEGMLESARLERVRDGIEDWMYLTMLQEALAGAAPDTPWTGQARVALRLRDAMVGDALITGTEVFQHQRDPRAFEEIRTAVGNALEAAP